MSGDFIDSNIFKYLFDRSDDLRRNSARDLVNHSLRSGSGVISFQVAQEVMNVVTQKMAVPITSSDAMSFLESVLVPLWRVYPSEELYRRALDLKRRYDFGFYDSLIVAAALEARCERLITEDLLSGQEIEGLRVENPFGNLV